MWRLKLLSRSCDLHSDEVSSPWDYDRYRADLPSPEPRQRAGYLPPATFLGEIADQADEAVSVSAAC